MSHRRGAPSTDKECVLRRLWYAEAQKKEFRGSDSSSSEDEVRTFAEEKYGAERKSTSEGVENEEDEAEVKETKKVNSRPPSTFTNFASSLGAESSDRIHRIRTAEKFDKDARLDMDREIRDFAAADLDGCLHKLADPPEPRAILICCGGFADNGRMLQEYGAFFADRGVQVLSFTFPGKLHRVHEDCLTSVHDYMDWIIAALLHHGVMIRLEKNKRQGVLPDMPPITIFGHDLGSTVAFELIRLLKKSKAVYLPVHHFIASACRPPEVISDFNSNEKSRKFSEETADALMRRFLELGFPRPHMCKPGAERTEILRLYLPCFRAEYRALETYNFKRSIGRQGPALQCDVTVLGGSRDVFAGGEQVLNKWRDSTSGDCAVYMFDKAGHFYWKHSDHCERQFLEHIMEKVFVTEEVPFDQTFLDTATVASLDESVN